MVHLMAYAHELKLTEDEEMRISSSDVFRGIEKIESILWLVTYSLLVCSVILFLLYISWWWIITAAGVLLSQTLIILDWHEAKYGTITNIIIVLVIISFLAEQYYL